MPVHFAVYAMLYVRQQRRVLGPLGLRPRRDVSALLLYLSVYPTCVAAMSLSGYLRHVVDRVRTWVPRVQPAVPTADRRAR